jgi:hypothetical protein
MAVARGLSARRQTRNKPPEQGFIPAIAERCNRIVVIALDIKRW